MSQKKPIIVRKLGGWMGWGIWVRYPDGILHTAYGFASQPVALNYAARSLQNDADNRAADLVRAEALRVIRTRRGAA